MAQEDIDASETGKCDTFFSEFAHYQFLKIKWLVMGVKFKTKIRDT